jgi:type I restriction enzyme S subunit
MALAPDDELTRRTTFQKSVAILKPISSVVDPIFLYYALRADIQRLIAFAGGTAQKNLLLRDLRAFEVRIPEPSVQRLIAGILSAYDELIENSQRRMRILEAMARDLYREWFVHFRFPGHESHPRVASALGKIPQGWGVKKFGDIVSCDRRATKPGHHHDERKYVPIDCLPSRRLALLQSKPIEEAQSSLQLFEKGDILFGAMRPYFHKVVVAPFAGVTRTTCFVFKPARTEWHAFATMTAFEDATIAYANAHSQGATIPYAVWDGSLANMPLVQPSDDLLRRFDEIVAPMLARLSQSYFSINNLHRTRDLLLPRLLSGQIDLEAA